ncbi:MAG: hypothetical protein IJY90_00760 [Clostridia bacterium]|nr:hypothetical protein [Clostridia bacterium]
MKIEKKGNKLVFNDFTSTKEVKIKIADILAFIPTEKAIMVLTKDASKVKLKTDDSVMDTLKINNVLNPVTSTFGEGEYAFLILSNHSLINIDELKGVTIYKKDGTERLRVNFGEHTVSLRFDDASKMGKQLKDEAAFNCKVLKRGVTERQQKLQELQ